MINVKRAYINATEYALKSLHYSLLIYPEDFYNEIQKYVHPDRIIPGKVIKLNPEDRYVILEPNYQEHEKKTKIKEEELKKLSSKERIELSKKIQEEIKNEQKTLEQFWEKTDFSRNDFLKVIQFIENNLDKYKQPPLTEKNKQKQTEEIKDFGMNYVYFFAANGFLSSFDPHSGLIDLESWDKMRKESEDSSFEGIGALLRGGGTSEVVVETPLPGSPAVKAGLRAGDVIKKVNGESIENLPLNEVVKKIRGPKDTMVELEIHRPIEMRTLTIKIKRGVIEQKAVSSVYLPESPYKDYLPGFRIGIIKITSFLYDKIPQSEMIRKEYYNLIEKSEGKLEGLIIDLRNNPGGDLDEAIKVAGLFLPENAVVVEIRGKGGYFEKRRNSTSPLISANSHIPIIVLVNAGSASASEIFASALMDHNVSLIVGERTFGKATVQGLRKIGDVIVKLTTARYYAPKGYTIQVYGVEPDIKISDEIDGSFPPRFREEDMWKHFPELEKRPEDPKRSEWVKKLISLNEPNSKKAEEYLKTHERDAIRPDAMLIRALGYIKAMKIYPKP
jgi:C-terminal peptidase prc